MQNKIRILLLAAITMASLWLLRPNFGAAMESWFGTTSSELVPIVVADHFIPPFQPILPDHARVRSYPREFVPPGALHALSDITADDGKVRFTSIVGIPENEPLTRTVLAEAGQDHGMSSLLRPGKVAVSFKAEKAQAAGGWIKPGDTVAIFARIVRMNDRASRQTRLLLSAVEVLGVDRTHLGHDVSPLKREETERLLDESSGDQIITVLTNTGDASALVEAQEAGPLFVVLRSLGDEIPWLPEKSMAVRP
jgi:Flp pilus assembly protein CpaB